jgi:hypothetical protein
MVADLALGDPKRTLGATGNYSYSLCSARYERVMSEAIVTNGAIPDTTQSRGPFVGIDGAHFALGFDPVWNVTLTPANLRQTLDTHCSGPTAWSSMLTKLGHASPEASSPLERNQCANSTYINTMLFGNSGLFRNNGSTFMRTVSSRQNGATVLTWTRGYLLQRYGKPGCADCQVTGVVEVGGASMQVSFPVAGNADPANNRYAVTIGGKAVTVYNKTFLGLGQDLARRSMAAQ